MTQSVLSTREDVGVAPARVRRWAMLVLALAYIAFATYYYLGPAKPTNEVVVVVGLSVLWSAWLGVLLVTLIARPRTRADRLAGTLAPMLIVAAGAMSFLAS
ncbi:hypothetical protein AB0N68_03905 [Microbacterium sp. NPDC089313]|uniref:hypothetical protein n=2 Tax=Microbacterium TaxID=33882 RepID=UPI0034199CC5